MDKSVNFYVICDVYGIPEILLFIRKINILKYHFTNNSVIYYYLQKYIFVQYT